MSVPVGEQQVPGAVVLGGDYHGLGIVRSLGRRGIPTCIIDDEFSIARFSRFATHSIRVESLREEQQVVNVLLEVGRKLNLRGWVVYPTRDEQVAALSRNRSWLTEFFRVPTPDWDTVQWLWDKRNTYHFAKQLGIPVPCTWYPRDLEDLKKISCDPPFAVKPAIKEHFFYKTKAKAWRANNHRELQNLFLKASSYVLPGEVMVQDLIPGDGRHQFAYCAFFKESRAIASMVVRRTRQHPEEFGRASTFVETVESPELEELSTKFLREIKYYGLVEIEYKLDPRDGKYKLLDVNGRTWGYHTLGSSAGIDFSHMLYADQICQEVQSYRSPPGLSWLRLVTDLPMGIMGIVRGRQHLWDYLRSTRFSAEAVFSRVDPLPAFAEVALLPYLFVKRGF